MNATKNPNTAKRFLDITDSFPSPVRIPDLMHEACQARTGLSQHLQPFDIKGLKAGRTLKNQFVTIPESNV
jgi:hypothetical protein